MNILKEMKIRRTLKRLSRQRVALVLQPGNAWVIEKAVEDTEETDAALKTCYLRGWVEPIENAIPQGRLTPEGKLPDGDWFHKVGPLYRVTEAGWAVVNRTHQWTLVAVFLAVLTIILSINQ